MCEPCTNSANTIVCVCVVWLVGCMDDGPLFAAVRPAGPLILTSWPRSHRKPPPRPMKPKSTHTRPKFPTASAHPDHRSSRMHPNAPPSCQPASKHASSRALIHGFKDLIIYKYALVCVHVSVCVCVLLAASSGNTCAVRCNCVNTRRPNARARARERHPSPTTRRTRFVNARMFTLSPNVRACVRA